MLWGGIESKVVCSVWTLGRDKVSCITAAAAGRSCAEVTAPPPSKVPSSQARSPPRTRREHRVSSYIPELRSGRGQSAVAAPGTIVVCSCLLPPLGYYHITGNGINLHLLETLSMILDSKYTKYSFLESVYLLNLLSII